RLNPNYICMKDDKYRGMEQVPFEINGRTSYGCCHTSAAYLQAEALRYSADPLTGEAVDKADAYIVLKPDGTNGVLYFKSIENYSKYTAMGAIQKIYLCSMHPDIRQTSPGACPKCGMELIEEKNKD
ncbi:MAG: hypothetical protein KBD53_12040, partial [Candidatus Omnitrophica bacterium]|nr:hypothetical protein [Candidatus Omnitrophota bacterium]